MLPFFFGFEMMKELELLVTGFSKKGNGVASNVEVPFAIPGDTVRVKVLRKSKGLYKSLLEEVINPSPDRITPRCIHFGTCGGCRWQQMPYEKQLQIKEESVRELFSPYLNSPDQLKSIIPCDPPWQYRNKMEFSFSNNAAKDRFLGLIMNEGKGRAINLTECHLVNPWFIEALKTVKSWWDSSGLDAYHLYRNTGSLRNLTMREGQRTGDRMIILTVSGNPDYALNQKQLNSFKQSLIESVSPTGEGKLSLFLRIQQVAKGTQTNFYEMQLHGPEYLREVLHITDEQNGEARSLQFFISPVAFFQPNTRQAEKLYSCALQMAGITEGCVVYDLYCGTGTLGICAAKKAAKVIGIEISKEAVLDAKENAKANGIENFDIICGDVGKELQKIKLHPKPDVVLVDPPRVGLGPAAVEEVVNLGAKQIVYVSCNPATQVEDVKQLISKGYKLKSMQPVDQFPHTPHIENVVILST